jgi:streptogramin lyase
MLPWLNPLVFLAFVSCVVMLTGFCMSARAQEPAPLDRADIRPSLVRLAPGEEQQFRVVLVPRRLHPAMVAEKVRWAVNDVPGGNRQLGTVDEDGVYRAPEAVPTPCEVHVCATADGAANPHLWATVLVGDAEPTYAQVAQWEEPDDGSAHLKNPFGIAVERDGNLVITDVGCSQVFRYTAEGKFLGTIGLGPGVRGPGHFDGPRHVLVDVEGNIVVSDVRTGPPRIQVFDREGKVLHVFAEKGVGPGQVMDTGGMGLDPDGRLFVADVDNMRVNVYGRDGAFIEAWERDGNRVGEFNLPYGIVTDASGDVFVSSYYGPCQKFTGAGEFLFAFAKPDPPRGPVGYTSAVGDRWGNVFLVVRDSDGLVHDSMEPEPKPARVLKYNNNGDLVTEFPLWDDECGENGVAVDADGRLYVLFQRAEKVGVATFESRE